MSDSPSLTMTAKIYVDHLAYVHYEHNDLDSFKEFAKDFGLVETPMEHNDGVLYFHGYGKDPISYIASPCAPQTKPKFRGAGFAARTREDFYRACGLPGATIQETHNRPGGGSLVSILDPNGFIVDIVWGQQEKAVTAEDASSSINHAVAMNGAIEKQRLGESKRFKKGPSMIYKLGHFGIMTDNYEATCDWYTNTLNLTAIDILHSPQDEKLVVASFYRIDLGDEFVDHHSLLITREGRGTSIHHSSFEVEDFDTQLLGHYWLQQQGHKALWGVGRHVHGSQLFDYWRDNSKHILEHYADGDMVNCHTPVTHAKAGNFAIWGPGVPNFAAEDSD